jgi:hypothetical protein
VNNKSIFKSSCKVPDIVTDFYQICGSSTGFLKSSHYEISRKSVQWEPPWYKRTHGVTDRHDEGKKSFSLFMPSHLKRQATTPVTSAVVCLSLVVPACELPSCLSRSAGGLLKYPRNTSVISVEILQDTMYIVVRERK